MFNKITLSDINTIWDSYFQLHPEEKDNHKAFLHMSNALNVDDVVKLFNQKAYPLFVLNQLVQIGNPNVDMRVVENPNCSIETLEKIYDNLQTHLLRQKTNEGYAVSIVYNHDVMCGLVKHPNSSLSLMRKVYKTEGYFVTYNLICNPNFPVSLFDELYQSGHKKTLYHLSESPRTPLHILEQLFDLNNETILLNLVQNPNTPAYMLETVLNHFGTRTALGHYVLEHKNTPQHILEKEYATAEVHELICLANNPSLPKHLFDKMKNYVNEHVQQQLIYNLNIPVNILVDFTNSENNQTRLCAVHRLFNENFFGDFPQEWVEAQYGVTFPPKGMRLAA